MTAIHEVMALAKPLHVRVAGVPLDGHVWLPAGAFGAVVFPHGRGTGRDPIDELVAAKLRQARIGAVFVNLLTGTEAERDARTAAFRFDVTALALRLMGLTRQLVERPSLRGLRLGYFGAGYTAAAAVMAAAMQPGAVDAIVALDSLPEFFHLACQRALPPTLLLGGISEATVEHAAIVGPCRPNVVGGNHSSEEIAALSASWFAEHLARAAYRTSVMSYTFAAQAAVDARAA